MQGTRSVLWIFVLLLLSATALADDYNDYDQFDRVDSATVGGTWTGDTGKWEITSEQLVCDDSCAGDQVEWGVTDTTPEYIRFNYSSTDTTKETLVWSETSSNAEGWYIRLRYGGIAIREPGGWSNTSGTLTNGVNHLIELKDIDWGSATFDVYIDGVRIFNNVPFKNSQSDMAGLRLYAGASHDIIMDNYGLGDENQSFPSAAPAAEPYYVVNVKDLFDSSNLQGIQVNWSNGQGNTTDSSGNAYCYNCSGGGSNLTYNISDSSNLYFGLTGETGVENATSNSTIYGAFVTLYAYDITNASVSVFNVTSGTQSNQTINNSLQLYLEPNTTNTIYVNGSGYAANIEINITTSAQDTGSYNLTGLYQSMVTINSFNHTGGVVNNFTVNYTGNNTGSVSTTSGTVQIASVFGETNYTVDATGFALSSQAIDVNDSAEEINFTLLLSNTLNITFYDEETEALLTGTDVSLEYLSTLASGNTSTNTSNLQLEVLLPGEYTLIYDADGYDQRFYEFTLVDRTFNNLNLSLLNSTSSTTVTITVKDTLNNRVENATVKIYQYDVGVNDYVLQEVRTTNFEGQTIAGFILNEPLYKFVVHYDGEPVLTTAETQIYGTTLSLIVDLITSGGFE